MAYEQNDPRGSFLADIPLRLIILNVELNIDGAQGFDCPERDNRAFGSVRTHCGRKD